MISGRFIGGRGGFVNVSPSSAGQAASRKPVSSGQPAKRRASVAGISYRVAAHEGGPARPLWSPGRHPDPGRLPASQAAQKQNAKGHGIVTAWAGHIAARRRILEHSAASVCRRRTRGRDRRGARWRQSSCNGSRLLRGLRVRKIWGVSLCRGTNWIGPSQRRDLLAKVLFSRLNGCDVPRGLLLLARDFFNCIPKSC